MNSFFELCHRCGTVYDTNDDWQASPHRNDTCTLLVGGFCYTCGGGMGNLVHIDQSNTIQHLDLRECIFHLKEQLRYVEQHNLEHDSRYCDLEDSVKKLVDGRKAAIEESRTLKAIRENANADVSPDS